MESIIGKDGIGSANETLDGSCADEKLFLHQVTEEDTQVDSAVYPPPVHAGYPAQVSLSEYKALYEESISDPSAFFGRMAKKHLNWIRPFDQVLHGSFKTGDVAWFLEGQLNAAYNCLDRHVLNQPDKIALIWEADEPGQHECFSYRTVLQKVCQFALVLRKFNIKKGDRVAIYMPMVPEAVYAMLACARIGAVHSVIFAGFSADALRDRIVDAQCKVLVTADEGRRGGKVIPLKRIADEAIRDLSFMEKVIVFQHPQNAKADVVEREQSTREKIAFQEGRDVWWHDEVIQQRLYCPCEPMQSEDPLFMLYTSGSTGKPKGVLHSTAGYLLGTLLTTKYVFDHQEKGNAFENEEKGDTSENQPRNIHGCMADIGWITGHSYIVYGPLSLGTTTVLFEGVPTYPSPDRYWQMVDQHKITAFYTAPTAIRTLKKLGESWIWPFQLTSLRVIGSVGEPINPEAWKWYQSHVGRGKCAVVDTYWQTETGSIVLSPLPGAIATKPGSATLPFFGIEPVILDAHSGLELRGGNVSGVLAIKQPFPSLARTIFDHHARYLAAYMDVYPGFYFTGDGATRDEDGYYWINGRVDDVLNIAGHRMSTAEIESALVAHSLCAEAAVVGIPDEVTGQSMVCFVITRGDVSLIAENASTTSTTITPKTETTTISKTTATQNTTTLPTSITPNTETTTISKTATTQNTTTLPLTLPTSITQTTTASTTPPSTTQTTTSSEIASLLRLQIRHVIGAFATPKHVVIVPDLPKTRSGKIMRRILRKIAGREVTLQDLNRNGVFSYLHLGTLLGDLSTLADPSIIQILIQKMSEM